MAISGTMNSENRSYIYHGVGVIVIRSDGAVLLQRRDQKPGVVNAGLWCYPGGRALSDESFETAAKRELQEEAGYIADELHLLLEEEYIRSDNERIKRHVYWTVYDGVQNVYCGEGMALRFMKIDEIDDIAFVKDHKRIIKQALTEAKKNARLNI